MVGVQVKVTKHKGQERTGSLGKCQFAGGRLLRATGSLVAPSHRGGCRVIGLQSRIHS
jgi:hypothetical protein